MTRAALLLLLLSFAACERSGGKKTPAAPPPPPPAEPKVQAPPSVPQEMADRIAREWPEIEKEGQLFLQSLAEATKARDAGDRAAMAPAVKEAQVHFDKAAEAWGEIVYEIEDLPTATADACRKYISSKDKQVQGWMEKAKALAQFSTAK